LSRSEAFLQMLEATEKIQYNIALILESKAVEADKSRNWICNNLVSELFSDHGNQLQYSLEIHEQLVEAIEGLTKVENGLSSNLKALLGEEEESSGFGGLGGLGDLFGGSGIGGKS